MNIKCSRIEFTTQGPISSYSKNQIASSLRVLIQINGKFIIMTCKHSPRACILWFCDNWTAMFRHTSLGSHIRVVGKVAMWQLTYFKDDVITEQIEEIQKHCHLYSEYIYVVCRSGGPY